MQLYNRLHKLNTAQIITLGFAGVIILGGLLLWLPFCTAPGYHTSFTDAMFTATTSICVTGLVTVVTATHWTLAGKIIILVLIQIGGVGLISLGSIIFISLRKKISLRNRRVIQESYNMDRMGGMVRLVKKVLICVFGAEGIGAVCYAVRFIPQFGLAKGLGYSVFTAVSAFCNAGIDLLGEDSLAQYVADPIRKLYKRRTDHYVRTWICGLVGISGIRSNESSEGNFLWDVYLKISVFTVRSC